MLHFNFCYVQHNAQSLPISLLYYDSAMMYG